jgi:hypothetical protein
MKDKKLAEALGKKVLAGEITVDQGRAALGRKPLPPRARPGRGAVQKSARAASPEPPPQVVPRYAGDDAYIMSAFAPMARPAVTKAAVPAPRESPAEILKALRELGAMSAEPVRLPRAWTAAEAATLREAEKMSDPQAREGFRSGLIARRDGRVT